MDDAVAILHNGFLENSSSLKSGLSNEETSESWFVEGEEYTNRGHILRAQSQLHCIKKRKSNVIKQLADVHMYIVWILRT